MDDLENDEFLQTAISDFTKAQRSRWLKLAGLCLLIFATGVLVGLSIKYEAVEITVEFPAVETDENLSGTKTTRI